MLKKSWGGGTGFAISLVNGKEVFDKSKENQLPYEVEHIYPDYSLYPELTKDTAYGFLTRGCPRCCSFCHVASKEGKCSLKVADLSEFWSGQKNIVLLDPNITACKDWKDLFQQLIDSKAWIDFSQGLDIRMMNEEKAKMLMQMKITNIHFAWDRFQDKDIVIPKFKEFKRISGLDKRKLTVYVLVNFDTTIDQDLDRIYTLKKLGYWPYVQVYDREYTESTDTVRKIQRWVNNRYVFETVERFEDYY